MDAVTSLTTEYPEAETGMSDPTWISLLPPLLAITLAIVIEQVYLSLAGGIWLGHGPSWPAGIPPRGWSGPSIRRWPSSPIRATPR